MAKWVPQKKTEHRIQSFGRLIVQNALQTTPPKTYTNTMETQFNDAVNFDYSRIVGIPYTSTCIIIMHVV